MHVCGCGKPLTSWRRKHHKQGGRAHTHLHTTKPSMLSSREDLGLAQKTTGKSSLSCVGWAQERS